MNHLKILVFLLAVLCTAVPVGAQDDLDAVLASIVNRGEQLEKIAEALETPGSDVLGLRDSVRRVRQRSQRATEPLRSRVAELREDLDRLGAPPEEGAPPESVDIQAERARLNEELSLFDGAIRQADLNQAEAERLIDRIAEIRTDRFYRQLSARGPSPLSLSQWRRAGETFFEGTAAFWSAARAWYGGLSSRGELATTLLAIAAAFIAAIAVFLPIRSVIDRIILRRISDLEPLPSRRILVAAARTAAQVVPGLIGGALILQALLLGGVIEPEGEALARAVWFSFVAILLVDGAALGVFAPKLPAWRVVPLLTSQVSLVRVLLLLATLVVGLEIILTRGADLFASSSALIHILQSLTSGVLAIILFSLCGSRLWRTERVETSGEEPEDRKFWFRVRLAGRLLAIAAVVAVLIGYVALGHYVLTRVFYLLGLAAVIWLLRALLREGVRLFDEAFGSSAVAGGEENQLTSFWMGVAIDIIAVLAFIPPAFLIIGAQWADVRDGVTDAFLGFTVGSVRISLAEILAALAVFIAVLYAVRLIRSAIETRILPRSRIDIGIQNSLKTLIGYVGLVLAFVAGVTTLGFDLSNLAIIAGALSVGIGFGLQSIVNNFVSGLILLFERPIKVGDWIVTASGEGIVKRISVRSTEIETFDRSSVIVPNSELISGAVTNWTHTDKLGRVIIGVGVSYDSDPEQVIQLLMEVADDNPSLLRYPAPFVYFADFADSSLNFELRGYLQDINNSLSTRTQLRVAIFKKLKEAGIEIPFPQRDLHIRSGQMPG